MNIPLLSANDIECRVQQVRQTYDKKSVEAVLLLYKDARCDMRYLDMLYGVTGWQRKHHLIGDRLYCTVEIWDSEKNMWIAKEDVGTESNTEKEKGQASDAFKRACFNIGIGRELYSAPQIKIPLNEREYSSENGRYKTFATFTVKEIGYDAERQISKLVIVDRFGNERYSYPQNNKNGQPKPEQPPSIESIDYRAMLISELEYRGINMNHFAAEHGMTKGMKPEEYQKLYEMLIMENEGA